jgi:hypothetical protein
MRISIKLIILFAAFQEPPIDKGGGFTGREEFPDEILLKSEEILSLNPLGDEFDDRK